MKKLNKLIQKFILVTLIISMIQPAVNAGVVKQLIEVDPQEQKIQEEERQQIKEEYEREVQEQQQQAVEKAKEIIEEEIEQRVEPEPPPAPVAQVKEGKYDRCFICRPIGALTGLVVSPIAGLVRGSVSKARQYGEAMDGGVTGIVGAPVGVVSGAVTGGLTGLLNGVLTGVGHGWVHPFTAGSYSLEEGDYDPYNFVGGM